MNFDGLFTLLCELLLGTFALVAGSLFVVWALIGVYATLFGKKFPDD